MKMNLFLNDYFVLLKLLHDNQTSILGKKVIPLTQEEVGTALKMSKVKINAMFVELQKNGYLIQETRGKYSLSDKSETIIEGILSIEEKIKTY